MKYYTNYILNNYIEHSFWSVCSKLVLSFSQFSLFLVKLGFQLHEEKLIMLNHFTTNAHCKIYLIEIGQDIQWYLCLNDFLFLWCVHLVPNLEIIPWNAFNCYKIMIKFDSLDAHALKVTIFKVILLLRRKKRKLTLSEVINKITSFHWEVKESRSDLHQLRNFHWVLVMILSADFFLGIVLDLQFVLCILIIYLPMCPKMSI